MLGKVKIQMEFGIGGQSSILRGVLLRLTEQL